MLPLQIIMFPRRITIAVMVAVAVLVFAGIFLHQVNAQPLARQHVAVVKNAAPAGTVYLSAAARSAAEAAAPKKEPMREMHIANNGLMLLRGAVVESTSLGSIHVSMHWGLADFSWTVKTNSGTQFISKTGEKETSEDIQVGDIVAVTGMLTQTGSEPTIDAQFVREHE